MSSDELLRELIKRFEHILVVTEAGVGAAVNETLYNYGGGLSGALGLAMRAQFMLMKLAEKATEEWTDREENG